MKEKNNNKQTSVDQLFNQLSSENLLGLFTHDQMRRAMEILDEAKAMHKEEIIKSFQEGQEIPPLDDTKDEYSPMNYYKQTFGGNNEQQ
jgi:hypothetical protein